MSRNARILSASFILALAACGGGTGPYGGGGGTTSNNNGNPGNGTTVAATAGLAFSPNPLTVNSGATVTFAFGPVAHNVFFDTPGAATPADIPGNNANVSIERTFTTAGTYQFHCTIHPGMAGSVVVR
jgi:plastocyanin